MQAPFHSPMFNMFAQDNGTIAAPLAGDFGLRRMGGGRNKRFMPPFGQPSGGYDSSGINPHGMYNGTFHQAQYPAQGYPQNPGGFMPMGGLASLFNRYRGG